VNGERSERIENGTEAMPLLELRGVTMRFGGVHAVDDLDLSIGRGLIFGIMGPNGAGKTTTINILTGFQRPTAGRVMLDGTDITGRSPNQIARLGIARSYQNVRLFPGLTVLESVVSGLYSHRRVSSGGAVLCLPGEHRDRAEARRRAGAILERVGVRARPDQIATTLSYGEQRRLEIARALALQPRLLLLDEPTAGMNPVESAALGDLFRSLRDDGITIALIEHNIRLVLDYCDQAAVLDFGRLLTTGTPKECVDHPLVREAYFGKKSNAEHLQAVGELRPPQGRP